MTQARVQLLQKAAHRLRRHFVKAAAVTLILIIASALFGSNLGAMLAVIIFIAAASFSTFYFNYVQLPINFELIKMLTVITAVAYNGFAAVIVGVASTFFGKALIGRVDEKLPISMFMISVIAVLAAVFSEAATVTTLGIALVLLYNATMLITSLALGGDLAWNVPYEGTNLVFNVILFVKVAPALLSLLQ